MVNSSESGKYSVKHQISPCLQLFKKIFIYFKIFALYPELSFSLMHIGYYTGFDSGSGILSL